MTKCSQHNGLLRNLGSQTCVKEEGDMSSCAYMLYNHHDTWDMLYTNMQAILELYIARSSLADEV